MIVGNGSLLIKRNKRLRIKFDDHNLTLTFEYPSEETLLAEPESPQPMNEVNQVTSTSGYEDNMEGQEMDQDEDEQENSIDVPATIDSQQATKNQPQALIKQNGLSIGQTIPNSLGYGPRKSK